MSDADRHLIEPIEFPLDTTLRGPDECRSGISSVTFEAGDYLADISAKDATKGPNHEFLAAINTLRIYGRKPELVVLRDTYVRVLRTGSSEVVHVIGESGCGKTALLEALRKPMTKNDKAYFASGKFDQLRANKEPYSAIVEAFSDVCILVQQGHAMHKATIVERLRNSLVNDEVALLSTVIPNFLLDCENNQPCSFNGFGIQSFIKFKLLCRKFLQAVATEQHPVVLLLDDLQWADANSKDVLLSLCTDRDLRYALILCAYRPVDDEGYKQPKPQASLPLTTIELSNLDRETTNTIISTLLHTDKSVTMQLSKVIHEKTGGNAFFLKVFLESLNKEGLLTCSPPENRWAWDLAKIAGDGHHSWKALIEAKLKSIRTTAKEVLKLASCLGYSFSFDHIVTVADGEYRRRLTETDGSSLVGVVSERDATSLVQLLEAATGEGLLEKGKANMYNFKHDRVFETVLGMLPTGDEREQMHLRIGEHLLARYGRDDDVVTTMLVTEQLNIGSPSMSREQKLFLAERNLLTAKLARVKAAFGQASHFVRKGIALLPRDVMWEKYYDLVLELHTVGASVVQVGGNPSDLADAVILNARCVDHKLPVLMLMVDYLSFKNQLKESLELGARTLKQLGEALPQNPGKGRILWELLLTKRAIGRRTDEELLALPTVSDKRVAATLSLQGAIFAPTFFSNAPLLMITVLRSVRLSIKYGLHPEWSPTSFAAYGMINASIGQVDDTVRFQRLAVKMLSLLNSKTGRCWTLYCSYVLGLHLRSPIEDSMAPLLESHDIGMKYLLCGKGLMAMETLLLAKFMCGHPLPEIHALMDRHIPVMKQHHQTWVAALCGMTHQHILNLMGRNDDSRLCQLTGIAMDQIETKEALSRANHEIGLNAISENCMQLNATFEQWDQAMSYHNEMLERPEGLLATRCHFVRRTFNFYSCLLHFVQFRRTKEKKHLRKGLSRLSFITKCVKNGCPNLKTVLPLLVAERFSFTANADDVEDVYLQAINNCRYVQLKALAHERAGMVMLERFEDCTSWKSHLEAARAHYFEWGAMAKVSHIERKLTEKRPD